jgi:hypothetical protein
MIVTQLHFNNSLTDTTIQETIKRMCKDATEIEFMIQFFLVQGFCLFKSVLSLEIQLIGLTGLTTPKHCGCLMRGPGFPISYMYAMVHFIWF